MKKKFLGIIAATAAIAVLLGGCGGGSTAKQAKEKEVSAVDNEASPAADPGTVYTLKISTSQTDQAMITQAYEKLAERLNEVTGGRMDVQVFPSNQLGSDEDVLEQAIQGAGVAVNTDAARMGTYVKDMGILMMGYFADDYDECYAVTETPTFHAWEEELADEYGIRVLAFDYYDGPRQFMTNREVYTPDDLKGLRVRTIGAEVCTETMSAMGATPVTMSWSETYNAIQSKALDACEAQNTSSYPSRIYEVCKYQIKTSHFQLMQALVCGESWFRSLPEDLQEILMTTVKEVGRETAQDVLDEIDRTEKLMQDAGLVIIEPDLEPFKAAADSVYDKLGFTELRAQLYSEIGKDQ